MKRDRNVVSEGRAETDASLDAERSTAEATIAQVGADTLRRLDTLIARDRVHADQRLMLFRQIADDVLADERSASPVGSEEVVEERLATDDTKRRERDAADAVLEHERRGADARDETRRGKAVLESAGRDAQRAETNERLSVERSDADAVEADRDASDRALERARREEAHRTDVFAMVVHDLRSPLCVIVANADFLTERAEDQDLFEAARDVTLAAARIGRLLTDLLDVARIDAGIFSMAMRPHDVGALVAEVSHSYRPLFDHRGVSLALDVPTSEIIASFDRDRVEQVLSNLLGNAMKFTPPGGSVAVRVEHGDEWLVVVVQDDGAGIHPDALPNVFERFWQRDGDSRRGLGLGLYLCRTIARAHGGDISVQSELGVSTTFRLSLPVS